MHLINRILNGLGQIMLQENRLTGLLFLMGLFIGHWIYGLAALLATLIGTLTAQILKFDKKEIDSGLYGFSPALVGVVLMFLFKPIGLVCLFIVIGSAVSAILQNFFIKRNFPAYTFPFILVSWILIFLLRNINSIPTSEIIESGLFSFSFDKILIGTKSFGQVIFQRNIFSGILFFIGVLISSRIIGILALIAAFLASFFALILGQNPESIGMGLFGFNAVLTAIVFAGISKRAIIWLSVSVVLTLVVNIVLVKTGIFNAFGGVLTFPFVVGVWLTLLLQKIIQRKKKV